MTEAGLGDKEVLRGLRIVLGVGYFSKIQYLLQCHVELFERTGELGGRLYEAGVHSFKDSIRELNAWYKLQMEQLGIKVHLNTEMTPAMVQAMGADAVILAVGADPVMAAAMRLACRN